MKFTQISPKLKIIYVIIVSFLVILLDNVYATTALFGLQIILLLLTGIQLRKLRVFKKIIPFSLAIIFFYSVFVGEKNILLLQIFHFKLMASSTGFWLSLMMVARFMAIFLASVVVRATVSPEGFVQGLVQLRLPEDFARILDSVLSFIEGKKGKGKGKRGKMPGGKTIIIKSLLKGDYKVLLNLINQSLAEGKETFKDYDLAVISAFTMIIVSMRFMDILPGFLIAPGYKNVVIIPLFILAALLTKTPYAATYVGFLSGTVNLMTGAGKFGIFGILQFMAPGLFIDLMLPFIRRYNSLFVYALVGFCAGLCRISALLVLSLLFRMPKEFYIAMIPFFIAQCVFGILSAPVTKLLIKHVK